MKKKYYKQQEKNKESHTRETPIRLSAYFSGESLQARREWHDVSKVLKGKNLQPLIVYPARLSLRIEGEINSFSDKQKIRVHQC